MRDQLAEVLHKAGALAAVLRVRRYFTTPTVSIVTYHHITEHDPHYPYDPDVADAVPAQFRRHMELLAKHCTPIGLDDLIDATEGKPIANNAVMVTFDDGYRSCHDIAMPILRSVGLKATFFVSTGYVSERRLYWWERISLLLSNANRRTARITYPEPLRLDRDDRGLQQRLNVLVKNTPSLDIERFLDELGMAFDVEWSRDIEAEHANRLVMTWDQVRALVRAGMDIGSHGRRHRVLQTLSNDALDDELTGSRNDLETELGRPIRAVAYPVGRSIAREVRIRRAISAAGYQIGLTNASGVNHLPTYVNRGSAPLIDPFDVRRLATCGTMSDGMFLAQVAIPQLAYVGRPDKLNVPDDRYCLS